MLYILEDFEASWSNYNSERVTRQFKAGETYEITARRPEGVMIYGFFIFANDVARHCRID